MGRRIEPKPEDSFIDAVLSQRKEIGREENHSVLNNEDVDFSELSIEGFVEDDSVPFEYEIFSEEGRNNGDVIIIESVNKKEELKRKCTRISDSSDDSFVYDSGNVKIRDEIPDNAKIGDRVPDNSLINNNEIVYEVGDVSDSSFNDSFINDNINNSYNKTNNSDLPDGSLTNNKVNIQVVSDDSFSDSIIDDCGTLSINSHRMNEQKGNDVVFLSSKTTNEINKKDKLTTEEQNKNNFTTASSIYAKEINEKYNLIDTERSDMNFHGDYSNAIELSSKNNATHIIDSHKINANAKSNINKEDMKHETMRSHGILTDVLSDLVGSEEEDNITDSEDSNEVDLPTTTLREIFSLQKFRTNQKEIVEASLDNQDVFVLMPTGGGKSITFQLPALLCEGVTLVISPLLSLIQDQLQSLLSKNIIALAISSQLTIKEKNLIFEIMQREPLLCKIFYVTPELLVKSSIFQKILVKINVSRIVIDEAHCVSQWGHDFRPDYKEIGNVLDYIYNVKRPPIIALTATASPKVECDVISNLKMRSVKIFRMSFNRSNLIYYVHRKTKTIDVDIVSFITTYYPDSCGIIYCTSKKECEMMSEVLNEKYGLRTRFYHAGLNKNERNDVQTRWNTGDFKIIVATIAFGMGIDKKDVRFVIHYSLPKSLEGYYQETGRAGRDSLESVCLLFYSYSDKRILEFMIDKGTNTFENKRRQKDELRNVIQYCENNTDCRRQQVLLHFGENFDPKDCKNTCDNCMKVKGQSKSSDFSEHAKNICSLVGSTKELTFNNLVDIYRGSANKKSSEYKNNFFYGKGVNIKRIIVERLIKTLLSKGFLQERVKRNTMGFSWNYLVTGKKVTGKIELVLEEEKEKPVTRNINYDTKKIRKTVTIEDDIKLIDTKDKTRKHNNYRINR